MTHKQEPVARTHHTTSSKKTTCLVFIIVILCVIIGLWNSPYMVPLKMNRQNKCSFSCQQWRNVMKCLWLEERRDGVIVASLQQTQRHIRPVGFLTHSANCSSSQGQTVKRLSLF